MTPSRTPNLERILDGLYANLKTVRKDTIRRLGPDALHIIDFHANNWIDIMEWTRSKYSRTEQMNILAFQFLTLFKEIYWLQLLLQYANYPMIYRNLRYILEMICQAYYIRRNYPDLSLDEQMARAAEMEEQLYGWNLVKNVLCEVLNEDGADIEAGFHPLWRRLSKYVHPSPTQMDVIARTDFSSFVTDSFSEDLARDAMKVTNETFDLVYAIIVSGFPKIKEPIRDYRFLDEWEKYLPKTVRAVSSVDT